MLHARGDVSGLKQSALASYLVCSTHVEMFPFKTPKFCDQARMLHARGDVSI